MARVKLRCIMAEADLRGWGGARSARPPIFCNPLFFFNHFEELCYVYPNTIETCLTLNYLLFGRQLLLSSNTTSNVAANLNVFSSTPDKINRINNHFWDRWRHEYAVNVRETQRILKLNIKIGKDTQTLSENSH